MRKHIQIKNSYNTWSSQTMKNEIKLRVPNCCNKYALLIVEWWLHNIGYWVTLPFVRVDAIKRINLRCKDVDLMVEEK